MTRYSEPFCNSRPMDTIENNQRGISSYIDTACIVLHPLRTHIALAELVHCLVDHHDSYSIE